VNHAKKTALFILISLRYMPSRSPGNHRRRTGRRPQKTPARPLDRQPGFG